jgi:hypothetical protein
VTEDGVEEGSLDGDKDGVPELFSVGVGEARKEGKLDGISDGTKPNVFANEGDDVGFTVPAHPKSTGGCDVSNVGKSEGTVDGYRVGISDAM